MATSLSNDALAPVLKTLGWPAEDLTPNQKTLGVAALLVTEPEKVLAWFPNTVTPILKLLAVTMSLSCGGWNTESVNTQKLRKVKTLENDVSWAVTIDE